MVIRFDTRNKKPKLWNVLIQAVFVIAALVLMVRDDAHRHAVAISALIAVFLLAVLVQLFVAFFKQLQYNPYSYNTIYYMGFAFFLLAVWIIQSYLTVMLILRPEEYQAKTIFYILMSSARNYMILSSPFILAFSVALCISNISLIRHEGKRLVNVLGIILAFLLVGGELFLFFFDAAASGSQLGIMIRDLIENLFAAVYLYFECMLLGIIVAFFIVSQYEPDLDKDFLVILGCGLRKDGTPSPLLRGRCDRALAFAKKQKQQCGKDLIFITSGGKGPDEPISESASMKRYLIEQGVPGERIIEENQSTDTRENMKFSKEKIWEINPNGKVAFATTNYHVFRSGLYARRVKMRAVGMGAKTKRYFWPNAAVREFVGLLTEHKLKQGLIFGGMIMLYVVLTLVVYR